MSLRLAFAAAALCLLASPASAATALFAGGCFWSVEAVFDSVDGVTDTVSGFAGGHLENPTYNEVAYGGGTGHYEVVQITYDPERVSYDRLLTVLWHSTDPTDAGGTFCDRGPTYRNAIFALDEAQMRQAQESMAALAAATGYTIRTELREAAPFWPAEQEHQNFHVNNPQHYQAYRLGCRRDISLAQLWGSNAYLGTRDNPIPQ